MYGHFGGAPIDFAAGVKLDTAVFSCLRDRTTVLFSVKSISHFATLQLFLAFLSKKPIAERLGVKHDTAVFGWLRDP